MDNDTEKNTSTRDIFLVLIVVVLVFSVAVYFLPKFWGLLLIVFFAGAVGGLVNAFLSDNGFVLPRTDEHGGRKIIRPGFTGNMLVGGAGGVVSWGLYFPLAAVNFIGEAAVAGPLASITLSALVGAALVGIAGARWLTNEVDKNLLRAVASEAVSVAPERNIATKLATETPAAAWKIAADEAAQASSTNLAEQGQG